MNRETRRSHGMSSSREFKIWAGIIRRCYNLNCKDYPRYGGAGVTVFSGWKSDFAAFYKHIGPRPTSKHTVDRIKNDRGYEPGNVRWATPREQRLNSSQIRIIEFKGESLRLEEWAERLSLPRQTIAGRLNKGWSVDRALSPRREKSRVVLSGVDLVRVREMRQQGLSWEKIGRVFGHSGPGFWIAYTRIVGRVA